MTPMLTKPLKYLRARYRARIARRLHDDEVARGAQLAERRDRVPIFILGSPRSGTTLLYQLLTEQLDVGYLTNVHAAEPFDVARVERERRPRASRTASDFDSEHGETAGSAGPSEAGEFWYRFFPRDPHQVHDHDATPQRTSELRAVVRLFADACGAPVVFKNVFNSLRIPVIARALPEARFVVIERDLESNARSLLAGRIKRGDMDAWWSARPDGSAVVADATPARQVAWQAATMQRVARTELARIEPERSMVVSYTELCSAPGRVLAEIMEWLLGEGVRIGHRADAQVPEAFERREGGRIDAALDAELRAAVAELTEAVP